MVCTRFMGTTSIVMARTSAVLTQPPGQFALIFPVARAAISEAQALIDFALAADGRFSMLRSNDPLPQNVIRFSEAFDRFFTASEPTAKRLEDDLYQAFKNFVSCSSGDCEKLQKKW